MAASGIRAPLTVDESDYDYSITRSNYYSDESDDGFFSNDDFESAFEIPNLPEQDEETNLISKLEFSRPSTVNANENRNNPDEEFGDDNVKENAVTRSLARTLDDSDGVVEVVKNADDDSATDEDVLASEVIPDVAVKVPIAKISFDSDDDDDDDYSEASVVSEDDGLSSDVRIPTIGILKRVDSTPKARVSVAGGEGDDDEVELREFDQDTATSDHDSDGDKVIDVELDKETATGDHDSGLNHETEQNLAEGEEQTTDLEQDPVEDNVVVEVREIDVIIDDVRMCADLLYRRDPTSNCGSISSHDSATELGTCAEEETVIIAKQAEDMIVDIKEVSTDCCTKNSDLSEINTQTLKEDISGVNILLEDAKLDKETNGGDKSGEQLLHQAEDTVELMPDDDSNDEQRNPSSTPLPNCEFEEELEKIQSIQVKYLRLLHRLGCAVDSAASKVLSFGDNRVSTRPYHLDSANMVAAQLELQNDPLNFSICILVIGKAGVGKSSTINSIFGETKTAVDAFGPGTTCVKEIIGMVDGVKIKVIDTPGLKTSFADQSVNRKVLLSIKKLMQKSPPDVILYVDRFDAPVGDSNDLLVLNTISSCLGLKVWEKCVLVLTHSGTVPPDGPDGSPLELDVIIERRLLFVQQGTSSEFMTPNPCSIFPVSCVENHSVLASDDCSWKSRLLLSCYSMKILSELNSVVMVRNVTCVGKKFNLLHNDQRDQTGCHPQPSSHLLTPFTSDQKNLVYVLKTFKNQMFGFKVQDRIIRVGEAAEPYVGADVELSYEDHSCQHHRVSLGLSVMKSRHEVVCGCYLRSRLSVGSSWRVRIGASLDSKLNGQVLIQPLSWEQVQIVAMALFPIARGVLERVFWR